MIDIVSGLNIDCIFVDTEHFPINWNDLGWICNSYPHIGLPVIVRIPRPDPFEACRVLDMGATGVVAAYIETAEQVNQLRSAVKLRPLKGKKLEEILTGKNKPDKVMKRYLKDFNSGHILIVNIESVPALESLDKILSVPDLDGVLIGPHDLSCSLGVPEQYDHPIFESAIRKIIDKARDKKIGVGIHNLPLIEQEIKYAKAGLNLILHLADITLFRNALSDDLVTIRKELGEDISSAHKKNIII